VNFTVYPRFLMLANTRLRSILTVRVERRLSAGHRGLWRIALNLFGAAETS